MTGLTSSGYVDDLDAVAHHLYGSGTDAIPNSFNCNLTAWRPPAAAGKPIWQTRVRPQQAELLQHRLADPERGHRRRASRPTSTGTSTGSPQSIALGAGDASPRPASPSTTTTTPSSTSPRGSASAGRASARRRRESPSSLSAFLSPDGTQLTLVLINTDGSDHQVTIDPGTFAGATSNVYRSLRDDRALRRARAARRHGLVRHAGAVDRDGDADAVTVTLSP